MQTQNFVEEQEASEIGHGWIDWAAKSRFECRFDVAGEARRAQNSHEFLIRAAGTFVLGQGITRAHRNDNRNDAEGRQ